MSGDANRPPQPASPQLDRAALERVLARATELQAGVSEPEEALSEQQIIELGKEVGLAPQHLKQALAEERTRVALPGGAAERGLATALFGGARAGAGRTVPGRPMDILAAMDLWMQREESLIVKRQFADRIVWEPRRDIIGRVRRAMNIGGRGYALARAFEVAATAVALDDERTLVRLDADLTTYRTGLAAQGVGATAVGAAATGTLVALGFAVPFAVAPAVILAAAGYFGARSVNARVTGAAQLALEQLLDRLERGELPKPQASLLSALAAAAATLPRRF